MAPATEDKKRFKPEMPKIPGVPDAPAQPARPAAAVPEPVEPQAQGLFASPAARLGVAVAVALIVGLFIAWWAMRASRRTAVATAQQEATQSESPIATANEPKATVAPPSSPGAIATVQEMAKPWASKKFFFRKRFTNESVPAMVVRLPAGTSGGAAYWAFSLQAPFGRCELEFVTDLSKLPSQFGYRASHPMVVDACNATLYDPLRMGTLSLGAWARGEVVQGAGVRPPIGIDVQVKGDRLFAGKME